MKYSLTNLKKKKKGYSLSLLLGAVALGVTGCSFPDTLITDSGSNVVQEVDYSQYLDLSVLDKQQEAEEQSWNGYTVHTLEYGTFETAMPNIKVSINVVESSPVKVEFSTGIMHLQKVLVSRNTYVEKGDPIAEVTVEINELDLEEQELKLQRVEEEYAEYQADYAKQHEEAVKNISVYELPGKIDKIEIAQMELDNEQRVAGYEKQIADYRKRIKEMKDASATTQITAPQSGYILWVANLLKGQELRNGDVICAMAPTGNLLLEFTDETGHYGYGMDLKLMVGDPLIAEEYDAMAVSALGKVLLGNWEQTVTRITGDYEMADLIGNSPYLVTGTTNVMENVLLIPVDAVTEDGDRYLVTVLHDDETLETRQFIPGGENKEYYWVYEGLEPGTKIIIQD